MYNTNSEEKVTAQNSANQSKLFNCFTNEYLCELEEAIDLNNALNPPTGIKVSGAFIVNYLKKADSILNKARISKVDKAVIEGAISALASLIELKTPDHYEFVADSYYPDDFEDAIKCLGTEECDFADEEELLSKVEDEMGYILNDWGTIIENGYYFTYEWEEAVEALESYKDVYDELGADVPSYIITGWNKIADELTNCKALD